MKLFIRIAAAYFGIIGLVSLLAPQGASGQIGHVLSAFDVFVASSLGAAIVTIALINWSLSSQVNRSTAGLLWANLFMNACLAIIDISAVMHKTIGSGSWLGISIHGVLAAGFVYFLYKTYSSKRVRR